MDESGSNGADPFTGPATTVDEADLWRIGAVLWTLAVLSVTGVVLVADGRLAAFTWWDASIVLARTFGGVAAFFVVYPILLAVLSVERL